MYKSLSLRSLFIGVFSSWFVCTSFALAQQSTDSASDAGVVGERIRKEAEEEIEPVRRESIIEQEPERAKPPPPSGEVRFLLQEVAIEGNTLLPRRALETVIHPYRHREVTLNDLQGLAEAIEQLYRRRGYLTTTAYLPPQTIEKGRVTLIVLEGHLGEVVIEGNRYFNASRIRWYLPIERGEPLQYEAIQRGLNQMNKNPDREVQALLRAGKEIGTTDLVLKVKERSPLHVEAQSDRKGTKTIGRIRGGFALRHNNLFGRDDNIIVGSVAGRDFGAAYAQYLLPLTPKGTYAEFGFSHSLVEPRREFRASGVNGISQTYTAGLVHPFLEEEKISLQGELGLDFKDSRTEESSGTSRRDRIRLLRFGPRLQRRDDWGIWSLRNVYAFGIDGLGATGENNPVSSRPGAEPDFFKVGLEGSRIQRISPHTHASLSLEAQFAGSKLNPPEQLYLGGADSVRGYPEGDYLADQGLLLRFEYTIPFFLLTRHWKIPPLSDQAFRDRLQLVTFFDRAYGRLRAVTGTERPTRNLMGLGTGVRLQVYKNISARLEWATRLGDRPLTDDSNSLVYFRIQLEN